jgi:hypothetical protein
MTDLTKDALRSAARPLHDALSDSARDLETGQPVAGHDHRLTLIFVASACFLLGFLWAKSRRQTF